MKNSRRWGKLFGGSKPPILRCGINTAEVLRAINDGDVSVQHWGDLAILNYTKQAQYAQHWSTTVRRCRGLVVKWDPTVETMAIVVQCPEKFFNHDEPNAPDISDWKFENMWVSQKLDGYYISVRNDSEYGLIVTSRGSFESRYAQAARDMLDGVELPKDIDFFCELLQDFPGDEGIIVTRHPNPKLVCWGVNGEVPTPEDKKGWPLEIALEVTQAELKEYMSQDVEGVVIYNKDTGERVKFKTEWYLEMHRAISNCTFKRAIEIVCGGGKIRDQIQTTWTDNVGEKHTLQISAIPEEHYAKMCEWEDQILVEFDRISRLVAQDYLEYRDKTPKEYALGSDSEPYVKSLVFQRFKYKNNTIETIDEIMSKSVWKTVKKRLLSQSNDEQVAI